MRGVIILIVVLMILSGNILAQDAPVNEHYMLEKVADIDGSLANVAQAGDERLFLVEREGQIFILENGSIRDRPFLDVSKLLNTNNQERGLLSVAFPPDYAETGRFYVNYIDTWGSTRVVRYQVKKDKPNEADADNWEIILLIQQPFGNHNAGLMRFGPDGYLYIATGDGGSLGDPRENGQDLSNLLGALLRIDVSVEEKYAIPPDNPFVGDEFARPEIWAYGLRNPWQFSFDRETGDLYIGDVGESSLEEINVHFVGEPGGENYGWNRFEGTADFHNAPVSHIGFTFPVYQYTHEEGCAVAGGYVYRGSALPELTGRYFYGDYCNGNIYTLTYDGDTWTSELFMETGLEISGFFEDINGELYILDHNDGSLWKLVARQ